jgi:hypothetical protein
MYDTPQTFASKASGFEMISADKMSFPSFVLQ